VGLFSRVNMKIVFGKISFPTARKPRDMPANMGRQKLPQYWASKVK
jgi:hypothetical protein